MIRVGNSIHSAGRSRVVDIGIIVITRASDSGVIRGVMMSVAAHDGGSSYR